MSTEPEVTETKPETINTVNNAELVTQVSSNGGGLIWLHPQEVIVGEEVLKARPMYDAGEEMDAIQDLVQSIRTNGQLHPIVVRKNTLTDGQYRLVAGRRRVEAANMINAELGKSEMPFRLKAVVVDGIVTDKEAFRAAIAENLKRKDLSPIQFAALIENVRKEFGWSGGKGTKKVAEYLQVSPAQITQHEKLAGLSEEHKAKVHSGVWSAETAFEVLNTKEDKRDEVIKDAERLAESESEAGSGTETTIDGEGTGRTHVTVGSKKGAAKVSAKHVRRAAKEADAEKVVKPRTKKDILEFFELSNGPAYGFENGTIRMFLSYLTGDYASGKGTERTLKAKFDAMTEHADLGSEVKAAPKKTTPKPKK